MSTTKKDTKATLAARNTKIEAAIEKNFAQLPSIMLAGKTYTTTALKAVYQGDSAAIAATDAAHKQYEDAVARERTAHAETLVVTRALRSYLLGMHGEDAVTLLGDFGFAAPKPKTKTVATKAAAVEKSLATRKVRGTMGARQKQGVTGGVTGIVVTPVKAGAPAPAATSTGTGTGTGTGTPVVTPPAPGPAAPAPSGTGTGSPAAPRIG
jgi:hypothetical protein